MSDIHIDDFYKDAAKILTQLYNVFPRKNILYVEDISGPDSPDEFGLHSERHQACFSTMLWLAESGYLIYQDTIRQEALDQVSLTHKSFTLLSTPVNIPVHDTGTITDSAHYNISQLRQALKSRSSSQLRHIVHQLLLL